MTPDHNAIHRAMGWIGALIGRRESSKLIAAKVLRECKRQGLSDKTRWILWLAWGDIVMHHVDPVKVGRDLKAYLKELR